MAVSKPFMNTDKDTHGHLGVVTAPSQGLRGAGPGEIATGGGANVTIAE